MKKINLKNFVLIFFLVIGLIAVINNKAVDELIYKIVSKLINETNTSIFKVITFLGSTFGIIIACILSIICMKKYYLQIALNPIIAVLINLILKLIVKRDRPIAINLIDETGYSFPSGHSMVSMAFYGFLIYLISKSKLPNKAKTVVVLAMIVMITLIGISRIYLGVHYPSDVIAGFMFGLIYLQIFIKILFKKSK